MMRADTKLTDADKTTGPQILRVAFNATLPFMNIRGA
jgi:hypothetical protein